MTQFTSMIYKDSWMASVNLKRAYFIIPIHLNHQALLRILLYDIYQFTAMPNGYADAIACLYQAFKATICFIEKV